MHTKLENPPSGFPEWPYTKIHLRENVIVNNIQLQIDQLHRETLRQIYVPPQLRSAEHRIEEVTDDQNGQPDNETEEGPRAGSSSSDSD